MTVDIEKLKALALAATPGPWDVNQASAMRNGRIVVDELYVYSPETRNVAIASDIADPATGEMSQDNAAYIAAACPATVLELIAEVERLRADAERYRWLRDKARLEYNERIFVTNDGHKDYYAPNSICESELDDSIDAAKESPCSS